MTKGDRVKVRTLWAGGYRPSSAWFGGYLFEREDTDDCVMVKITAGVFAGQLVRYHKDAVRIDSNPDKRVEFE